MLKHNNGGFIIELPEENELVVAVIKKIMPYGAFCVLPEYQDMEAFMHISEVAPRWIKNIHEFISEGQRHVAKVHHIDREKRQVDISLKRVNEEEKKVKLESMKIEKKTEKLLEILVVNSKSQLTKEKIKEEIEKAFADVITCLEEVSERGGEALEKVDLPKALKANLVELAKKNVKKPVAEVSEILHMTCYGSDGINIIKNAFATAEKKKAEVHYLGAPTYKITMKAPSYKEAEKNLTLIIEEIEKIAQKGSCEFSHEKESS